MNADEARELAKNSQLNQQYHQLIVAIKAAAQNGKTGIWTTHYLNEATLKKLREDGYRVGEPQQDRNETITEISWK